MTLIMRKWVKLAHTALQMQAAANALGLGGQDPTPGPSTSCDLLVLYDELITDQSLRTATRNLYSNRHYAQAVEEACKCLNHTVKARSGEKLDGVELMQRAFSEKSPILRINQLSTESEKNEQSGYQMIMAGLMRGVRNPRAHEPQHRDDSNGALELLVLVNHLLQVIARSKRTRKRKRKTT